MTGTLLALIMIVIMILGIGVMKLLAGILDQLQLDAARRIANSDNAERIMLAVERLVQLAEEDRQYPREVRVVTR